MEPHGPRRYVVQQHELSAFRHWDLMLEQDEGLATWQLAVPPEVVAVAPAGDRESGWRVQGVDAGEEHAHGEGILAKRLADHRKSYLDYEGPVSGGRGEVRIVDSGTYLLLAADDAKWLVELAGRVLRGRFQLVRRVAGSDDWRLTRCRDNAGEAARSGT